ncbi:MAG: prohibitin family protein, partial [Chloroflexaceae bacterium]|nr:prohibitin family protein [Chloroflexaceae bacterium]
MTAGSVSALMVIGIVLLVATVFVTNSMTVIDAGTRGVVKRFGEVQRILPEGLHFRTPFVTEVTIVDVKTQRRVSNSTAASRDLQTVTAEVVLNYRPNAEQVDDLVREIGVGYVDVVIDPAIQESVKAATAQFTAEELITQRPLVSQSIREVLQSRLEGRGIVVEELS